MEKKTLILTVICVIVLGISIIGNLLLWRRLEETNSQMTLIETQIQRSLDEISSKIDISLQEMTSRITTTENRLNESTSQLYKLEQKIENLTAARTWHKVEAFTGSDAETTEVFFVEGDLWKVRWTAKAKFPSFALFAISVCPEGVVAEDVSSFIIYSSDFTLINPQVGVEYIVGKGGYYIKIFAANLDNWVIIVESYH